MPKGSNAYKWLRNWQNQKGRDISPYRGYTIHIVDDTGEDLGTYDLGDNDGPNLSKPKPSPPDNPWAAKLRAMEEEGF